MKQTTFQTIDKKCNRQASQTCRNTIARISFLTALCIFSFLASLPEVSHAQCPGSSGPAPDPSICPWHTNTITITVPGTSCTETVTYCWRVCGGGQNEVWVTNIQPGSGCSGVYPRTMIEAARQAAADTMLINNSGIPVCPNVGPILQVIEYVPSCWEKFMASGQTNIAPCTTDCLCTTTCDVCIDASHIVEYSNCNTTESGTQCGMNSPCTPDPGVWVNGTCYTVCPQ